MCFLWLLCGCSSIFMLIFTPCIDLLILIEYQLYSEAAKACAGPNNLEKLINFPFSLKTIHLKRELLEKGCCFLHLQQIKRGGGFFIFFVGEDQ